MRPSSACLHYALLSGLLFGNIEFNCNDSFSCLISGCGCNLKNALAAAFLYSQACVCVCVCVILGFPSQHICVSNMLQQEGRASFPEEAKGSLASSSAGGQDSSNRSEKPVPGALRYACRLSVSAAR